MKYHFSIFAPFLLEVIEASLCHFYKNLVLIIKMSTSQNFKTILKYNLTCIFLSLRAQLKKPLCPRTPCIIRLKKTLLRLVLLVCMGSLVDSITTQNESAHGGWRCRQDCYRLLAAPVGLNGRLSCPILVFD